MQGSIDSDCTHGYTGQDLSYDSWYPPVLHVIPWLFFRGGSFAESFFTWTNKGNATKDGTRFHDYLAGSIQRSVFVRNAPSPDKSSSCDLWVSGQIACSALFDLFATLPSFQRRLLTEYLGIDGTWKWVARKTLLRIERLQRLKFISVRRYNDCCCAMCYIIMVEFSVGFIGRNEKATRFGIEPCTFVYKKKSVIYCRDRYTIMLSENQQLWKMSLELRSWNFIELQVRKHLWKRVWFCLTAPKVLQNSRIKYLHCNVFRFD